MSLRNDERPSNEPTRERQVNILPSDDRSVIETDDSARKLTSPKSPLVTFLNWYRVAFAVRSCRISGAGKKSSAIRSRRKNERRQPFVGKLVFDRSRTVAMISVRVLPWRIISHPFPVDQHIEC